ncbi:MAG: hypothetical protein M1277_00510 [Patescibacteria group bacterium]|nr:hypothetical protein [Patescibacteria group bacterium]
MQFCSKKIYSQRQQGFISLLVLVGIISTFMAGMVGYVKKAEIKSLIDKGLVVINKIDNHKENNSTSNSLVKNIQVLIPSEGGRVAWSNQNIIAYSKYPAPASSFHGEIYTMNPDGSNQTCITCGKPQIPHLSNDIPAWSPNGQYIVFQSVDPALFLTSSLPEAIKEHLTEGGSGVDNNLWAATPNGSAFYQLTNTTQGGAVLHPQFSPDGKKIFWAARVVTNTDSVSNNSTPGGRFAKLKQFLLRKRGYQSGTRYGNAKPGSSSTKGEWMLKVADFVVDNSGPHLENIRSYQPLGPKVFYESHSWTPDSRTIIFSSSANPTASQAPSCACALSIWKLNIDTQKLTPLTHTHNVWNEHAYMSHDGNKIAWISSRGYNFTPSGNWGKTLQTDFWLMNADGTNKEQLTYFNVPGSSEYNGDRTIVADSSWNPQDNALVATLDDFKPGAPVSEVIVIYLNRSL